MLSLNRHRCKERAQKRAHALALAAKRAERPSRSGATVVAAVVAPRVAAAAAAFDFARLRSIIDAKRVGARAHICDEFHVLVLWFFLRPTLCSIFQRRS